MGEVIRFVSKSERERIRLIREARATYESIFGPAAFASKSGVKVSGDKISGERSCRNDGSLS